MHGMDGNRNILHFGAVKLGCKCVQYEQKTKECFAKRDASVPNVFLCPGVEETEAGVLNMVLKVSLKVG